jgi:hypothetical protein
MSNYIYNPTPARAWSRVENPCVFVEQGSNYEQAFIPLTMQLVSQEQANYEMKQIYKGNILQYKGNSARLTKSQRYSQLSRLVGPNRTKVFATQSQVYTNPNKTGLLRVGTSSFSFPNQIVGAPNNISGPFAYGIPDPDGCLTNAIQDGGTLVCGTLANPCTGEVYKRGPITATVCNPSSSSNVPGPSLLCWNNKVQSWFPRQRYFMNNSANKWPVNYKALVSASTPVPPILTGYVLGYVLNLAWQQPTSCYTITSYSIFVNNVFYDKVSANINAYNLTLSSGDYKIYIRALSGSLISKPSNVIDFTVSA